MIYGFAEGHSVSKRMRKELSAKGFTLSSDPKDADIIMAHSGGSFMLPAKHQARLVVLINPPMWLGRSPLRGLTPKVKQETKNSYWYRKSWFNFLYLFSRPASWARMSKSIKRGIFHTGDARTVIIRNRHDTFAHPEDVLACSSVSGWMVCSLDGSHDDLWEHPSPYVDLIKILSDEHGVALE